MVPTPTDGKRSSSNLGDASMQMTNNPPSTSNGAGIVPILTTSCMIDNRTKNASDSFLLVPCCTPYLDNHRRMNSILEKASELTRVGPSPLTTSTSFPLLTTPCGSSSYAEGMDFGEENTKEDDDDAVVDEHSQHHQQRFVAQEENYTQSPSIQNVHQSMRNAPRLAIPTHRKDARSLGTFCTTSIFQDVENAPQLPCFPDFSNHDDDEDSHRPMPFQHPLPLFSPLAVHRGPVLLRALVQRRTINDHSRETDESKNDETIEESSMSTRQSSFLGRGLHRSNSWFTEENSISSNNNRYATQPPPLPSMNTPDLVVRQTVPDYHMLKMRRLGCPPPSLDFCS